MPGPPLLAAAAAFLPAKQGFVSNDGIACGGDGGLHVD
jgi:hypothetical protein